MPLLETAVPPLAVAFAWQSREQWRPAHWHQLESVLARSPCTNPHYRTDVVALACRMRASAVPAAIEPYVLPPVTSSTLFQAGPANTLDALAVLIATGLAEATTVSLYMHTIAAMHASTSTSEPATTYETASVTAIVRGFAGECKFKRTGDLFIHSIIKLRVPAWLTAAHAVDENPFAVASLVHTDRTNATVQPLIKNDVNSLLDLLAGEPLELFCIYASLAIELLPEASKCVLVNSQVLMADPAVATLAVVSTFEIDGVTDACGYMLHDVFYATTDPLGAVAAWAVATAPESALAQHAVAGLDTVLDSPLSKFIR